MPERLPVARVVEAVRRLTALDLRRNSTPLITWLALKAAGATDHHWVDITTGGIEGHCSDFFAVPGREPYVWYEPFAGSWQRESTNGGWPIGTIWTQITRPSKKLRAVVTLASTGAAGSYRARATSGQDYIQGLQAIVAADKRVPALELAIWRYRFGLPDGVTDDAGLVEVLASALNLTTWERQAVFRQNGSAETLPIGPSWPDATLAAALPAAPTPQPSTTPAPPPPRDRPEDDEDDYAELSPWAELPLESVDVDALVAEFKARVLAADLLLPDADDLIEQCVLALLTGHLVLQGPPGTGKTTLARMLADSFSATSELQTATADWSTFDVIGGLQPSIGAGGTEVLKPWLGHVPRAALRCLRVVREHEADPDMAPSQAHWLIIDEFSRAEIDKAIGGLYTVLGGSGEQDLTLWFADDPKRSVIRLPRRFRIIATMNDVDASFVYNFSQGLSRRFEFVTIGVPGQESLDAELTAAIGRAAVWLVAEYPDQAGTQDPVALTASWMSRSQFVDAVTVLREFIARVRYPEAGAEGGGWPVGTAQVGDVLRRVALRADSGTDLVGVIDSALAARVVPQMSGIAPVAVDGVLDWIRSSRPELQRTAKAATHLRDTQATG